MAYENPSPISLHSLINSPSCVNSSTSSLLLHNSDVDILDLSGLSGDTLLAMAELNNKDKFVANMAENDVTAVMGKTLGHLKRITEHLREKGCNEEANAVAKAGLDIYVAFNGATADWDIEKCLMKTAASVAVAPAANPGANAILVKNVTAGGQGGQVCGSWAAVAATSIDGVNHLVKYRPSDGLKRSITAEDINIKEDEARVLWLKPWDPSTKNMSSITEVIDQGPLLSMAYSESDRAVCLIFQHAHHARGFLEANMSYARRYNCGLLGPTIEVLEGQAYPYDEGLERMENPMNERRRLTFARQRLFADGMGEAQFRRDLVGIVGAHNIELIWLFNTGNATVVFSATVIARLVRDEFLKRARRPGPYQNVMVGFSHDPCERPLHLITQIPGARNGPPSIKQDYQSSASSSRTAVPVPPYRRATTSLIVDEDGWQTVGRKK